MSKINKVAKLLKNAGWKDSADAQWSNLEKALPELATALALPDAQPVEVQMQVNGSPHWRKVDGGLVRAESLMKSHPRSYKMRKLYTTPQPAAATEPVPLTNQEVRQWWAAENSLEDCDMCKLDDFEKVVRALESKLHARQAIHGQPQTGEPS